jgi:hypothetical protein
VAKLGELATLDASSSKELRLTMQLPAGEVVPILRLEPASVFAQETSAAHNGLASSSEEDGDVRECFVAYAANQCLTATRLGARCAYPNVVYDYVTQAETTELASAVVAFDEALGRPEGASTDAVARTAIAYHEGMLSRPDQIGPRRRGCGYDKYHRCARAAWERAVYGRSPENEAELGRCGACPRW